MHAIVGGYLLGFEQAARGRARRRRSEGRARTSFTVASFHLEFPCSLQDGQSSLLGHRPSLAQVNRGSSPALEFSRSNLLFEMSAFGVVLSGFIQAELE